MREPITNEFLSLTGKWEKASPKTIAGNTEKQLTQKYPECRVHSVMYNKLSDMTGSSKHTVYAWFNQSRGNVKIPLVKLCMIAENLRVDVQDFLMEDEE